MVQVLAIAGSARRGGNSDTLLDRAIEGMEQEGGEVQRIVPYEMPITPCRSCGGCWDTGVCVIKDTMTDLYPLFNEVDHVVVSSPIYFTSLPGHLKVFIDRFQCFWVRAYRLKQTPEPRRAGMFFCISAMSRDRYFEGSLTIIKAWMSTFNMKCSIDGFFPGIDEKEAVLAKEDYLERAYSAGRELVRLGPVEIGGEV